MKKFSSDIPYLLLGSSCFKFLSRNQNIKKDIKQPLPWHLKELEL